MVRPQLRMWPRLPWHRRRVILLCIDERTAAATPIKGNRKGRSASGSSASSSASNSNPRAPSIGHSANSGISGSQLEHGRPIRRLARVLRGDEGIFRPIRQDHEAMAPQNISIGVRGHVRSDLQKALLLDALCFRPRIFGKKSASRSPQHHKESPQRINRKIQLNGSKTEMWSQLSCHLALGGGLTGHGAKRRKAALF